MATCSYSDTRGIKISTNNNTLNLTTGLIKNKPIKETEIPNAIPGQGGNIVLNSVTISCYVSNAYKGTHKIRFVLIINNEKFASNWKSCSLNGGYAKITLPIDLSSLNPKITISQYNTAIDDSNVKLNMEVTRTTGSGTLYYRADHSTKPKITYTYDYEEADTTVNFTSPENGSHYTPYQEVEFNILNSELIYKYYQIKIGNSYIKKFTTANIDSQVYDKIEDSDDLNFSDYAKKFETIGACVIQCFYSDDIDNFTDDNSTSITIYIDNTPIYEITPTFIRYEKDNGTYNVTFNGDYFTLSVTVTIKDEDYFSYAKEKNLNDHVFFITGYDGGTNDYVIQQTSAENKGLERQYSIDLISLVNTYQISSDNKIVNIKLIACKDMRYLNNAEYESITVYENDFTIPDPTPIFHIEPNGVAIGQEATNDPSNQNFTCAWPAHFLNGIYLSEGNNVYKLEISNGQLQITQQ